MWPMVLLRIVLATGLLWAAGSSAAWGQYRAPVPAPRLPPLVSSNNRNIYAPWNGPASNPYSNHSSALRAAPLAPDSLGGGYVVPLRAPYSIPYGPYFSRPPGSPIVPFGSSGYYYRGWTVP